MQREWFVSIGAAVLAFLSGQHHSLMMLLILTGLSSADMGNMTAVPTVRRAMCVLLRVRALWSTPQAEGRLLRVLLLWRRSLSANSGSASER
jgi:hypothetical protein